MKLNSNKSLFIFFTKSIYLIVLCMCLRTRQAANEPIQLLFRDVGPREIQCNRLSLYDAC